MTHRMRHAIRALLATSRIEETIRAAAWVVVCALSLPAHAAPRTYDVTYRVELQPDRGTAQLSILLERRTAMPSRLAFRADPKRYSAFSADGSLQVDGEAVVWKPPRAGGELRYVLAMNHRRGGGGYDSRLEKTWALFRGDDLVPPVRVTAPRSAESRATLELELPADWSVVSRYRPDERGRIAVVNDDRRFDRPTGWMMAGHLNVRRDVIAGVTAIVAAPEGSHARQLDTLAFLGGTLPSLTALFPEFPRRIVIVRAGDPMWRGGLSGPASLFLHADRPLISENRTSSLLHELIHVAMGLRGDEDSKWIVEGFAEYYSIETLRRSGAISQRRFEQAFEALDRWGRTASNLFARRSHGAITARAILILRSADQEIRAATAGRASLDDVARELASERGEVSLERLQDAAARVAGRPLRTLTRGHLSRNAE